DLALIQAAGAVPATQVLIVDPVGTSGIGAAALEHVVELMRPGVSGLEGKSMAERMAEIHLEGVVIGVPGHLALGDVGIAAIRNKELGGLQVVHEDVLHIAVALGVTALRTGQGGNILGTHADGNLVDVDVLLEVVAQSADIADAENVIPRKLVLD